MIKTARLERIFENLKKDNINQILITDPIAIYYLLEKYIFPGERFLGLYLNTEGRKILFVNRLYPCEEELGVEKVWLSDTDDAVSIVSRYLEDGAVIGVDKNLPARFLLPLILHHPKTTFVNASGAVDRQRGVKDEDEIRKMIISSEINDKAMSEFRQLIREGATEVQIAEKLPGIYKRLGADKIDFGIVAFGANAADPHHRPDDTVLKAGDAVLFDVGCVTQRYCSDMTRTFFYKEVADRHREVYEIVKEANEAAEAFVRPGVTFAQVDAVARNIISKAGYGEYFTHRLGHFIGLQGHEVGDVSSSNNDIVREGMIFSIEPGIYLPKDVGVRIEDLVLVTADGVKVLNQYDKQLEIVA